MFETQSTVGPYLNFCFLEVYSHFNPPVTPSKGDIPALVEDEAPQLFVEDFVLASRGLNDHIASSEIIRSFGLVPSVTRILNKSTCSGLVDRSIARIADRGTEVVTLLHENET